MPRLVPPPRERTPFGGTSDPSALEPHGRSVSVPGSKAPVWDARHAGSSVSRGARRGTTRRRLVREGVARVTAVSNLTAMHTDETAPESRRRDAIKDLESDQEHTRD
jgi:hypothetical protein